MARPHVLMYQDVTNFDGCGFGKYCYILVSPASLVPHTPSHNLLVRGSNPCGGTNYVLHRGAPTEWLQPIRLAVAPSIFSKRKRR
jgi:hypothetical protein